MNSGEDIGVKSQDIYLFSLIYKYLVDRPNSSFREIAEYLGRGLTAQKISALIERLEGEMGGIRLIDRKPKSSHNTLTPAATEVYTKGVEAIHAIQSWPGQDRPLITVGAPNLLIQSVLPRSIPLYRKYLDKISNPIDIRIKEQTTLDNTMEQIKKGAVSFALCWIHDGNERYISFIGKNYNDIKVEDNYFKTTFDVLMVCPFGHQFVEEARRAVGVWKLDLSRLADELVYLLPSDRQPLYGLIPIAADPRNRVEQTTYMDIIARLRCHVHKGIGLVPSTMLPELNEMQRKGQLYYAPVTASGVDEGRLKVKIGCMTKKGIMGLDKVERKFFELMAEKLREIESLYYQPAIVRRQIPDSPEEYPEFKCCYFVMQPEEIGGVPRWFEGDLDLKAAGEDSKRGRSIQKFTGEFTAYTDKAYVFIVDGELFKGAGALNRLFQFEAWGKDHRNTIHCTFNMIVNDPNPLYDALVGVWSGRDDKGLPTIAPMVLSRSKMNLEKVRTLVHQVSFRSLPNAEINGT